MSYEFKAGPFKGLTVILQAYNLTNEETYEQIHNAQVVPGPGRTFILSTRLRF